MRLLTNYEIPKFNLKIFFLWQKKEESLNLREEKR